MRLEDGTWLEQLPGAELVLPGLQEAEEGRVSIAACLVWMAMPHFARAGLLNPAELKPIDEPELTLYRLLRAEGGDAYGRYNSLRRRLVSFHRALERGRRVRAAGALGENQRG